MGWHHASVRRYSKRIESFINFPFQKFVKLSIPYLPCNENKKVGIGCNLSGSWDVSGTEGQNKPRQNTQNILKGRVFMRMMLHVAAAALAVAMAFSGAACTAKTGSGTTAESGSGENVQIPNPWVDCKTIEDAQALAGFDFQLPELPEGYTIENIRVIQNEILQVTYTKGEQEICIRKGVGTDDISGDYNVYDTTVTQELTASNATLKGNGGDFSLAIWNDGEYAYAVSSSEALTEEGMTQLAGSVELENLLIGGDPATWGPALSSAT